MKKALSLILVLVMICSFAACGNKNNSTPDKNPAIVKFMDENEDSIKDLMEEMFASSGMTCRTEIEVIGNGFVVSVMINELQDVPEETKELMQETYDSMGSAFDSTLEQMQAELPELEYWTIKVCEKDGDVLATVRID